MTKPIFRTYGIAILLSIVLLSVNEMSAVIATENKFAMIESDNIMSLSNIVKVVDLTQPLNGSVPTYDGKAEEFKYQTLSTVDKDGYASGAFFTHEHLGTHIDAPVHFCPAGITVDKIDPKNLLLPAVVINVQKEVEENPDYLLTVEKIKEFEKNKTFPIHSAVLLLTGWSKRYFLPEQYRNADYKGIMHFPGFSLEAAQYLVNQHKIAALGIDTLSIDHGPSEKFPVHKFVLSQGIFMVENLTNLDQLPSLGSIAIFAPLKIENGTGSPARVLALLP